MHAVFIFDLKTELQTYTVANRTAALNSPKQLVRLLHPCLMCCHQRALLFKQIKQQQKRHRHLGYFVIITWFNLKYRKTQIRKGNIFQCNKSDVYLSCYGKKTNIVSPHYVLTRTVFCTTSEPQEPCWEQAPERALPDEISVFHGPLWTAICFV